MKTRMYCKKFEPFSPIEADNRIILMTSFSYFSSVFKTDIHVKGLPYNPLWLYIVMSTPFLFIKV